MVTAAVGSPGGSPYCLLSPRRPDLPGLPITTGFNALFRQRAGVSLLRLRVTRHTGLRNIHRMSVGVASRLTLRSRLTLIRLALIRNPWSFGEGVSRPLCRYLYLHLLFRHLQRVSRHAFSGGGMLPYQSVIRQSPRLRHRTYARLLSTRGRSTSELLRTL